MIIRTAIAAALIGTLGTSAPTTTIDPVFPRGLPSAPSEDTCNGYRCVWDAQHQGNGRGYSLILTRYHGEYLAKRISHERAHRLQRAYCERPTVVCGYEI